jgi:hypothetical protein
MPLVAGMLVLLAVEYGSAPMILIDVPTRVPDVYRLVSSLENAVIVELPMPRAYSMPRIDPEYAFWSITHWRPLVNGYSGYVPPAYVDTLNYMEDFPDDKSLARLKQLNVRYVLVHEGLYNSTELAMLMMQIVRRPELVPGGKYRDWFSQTSVYELRR